MKLSNRIAFHKQKWQKMQWEILLSKVGNSQLVVAKSTFWQYSLQKNAIRMHPKPAWKHTELAVRHLQQCTLPAPPKNATVSKNTKLASENENTEIMLLNKIYSLK